MVIISKNYVLALLISHLSFLLKKTSLWGLLKWWAGVDSNHRSLATADLQSAPFSHSGTYPYLIFNKFAFDGIWTRGLSLTKGVRYPCATKAHLTRWRKAGNRNRTYNLRFTKPLLYRWAMPANRIHCIWKKTKSQELFLCCIIFLLWIITSLQ